MKTTLYENGNAFEVTLLEAKEKNPGKIYIYIDNVLHEVISKVKINGVTVTDKMSLDVIKDLNLVTKNSLLLVRSLIKQLMKFNDDYSKNLIHLFNCFESHKDFEKMRNLFEATVPNDDLKFHKRWDFKTRCLLLEVIYPAAKELQK